MIIKRYIDEWRQKAAWTASSMVEQDLIINRALVCLYNNSIIASSLLFRGGTALNKIYFQPAARYSEDIDLVQIKSAPIGPILDSIRSCLDGWLGGSKTQTN